MDTKLHKSKTIDTFPVSTGLILFHSGIVQPSKHTVQKNHVPETPHNISRLRISTEAVHLDELATSLFC